MPASANFITRITADFVVTPVDPTHSVATFTPTTGTPICVFVNYDASTGSTVTCSDSVDGAYAVPSLQVGTNPFTDGGLGQTWKVFVLIGNTGGARTLTLTWSVATAFRAVEIYEGVGTNGTLDGGGQRSQTGPGAAGDAITTTTSVTNAVQPAIIIGCGWNGTNQVDPPAAGTGFTSLGSDATIGSRGEFKRITTTGAAAGTWTAAGGTPATDHYISQALIFDEAVTLTPMSWAPDLVRAPVLLPIAGQSRTFMPVLPQPNPPSPPLAWAPSLISLPVAPLAPPPPHIRVTPFSPEFPLVPLAWAPKGQVPPPGIAPMPQRAFNPSLLPIPNAPSPAMAWAPKYTPLPPPLPEPPPPHVRITPFVPIFPLKPLSWAPSLARPQPAPIPGQAFPIGSRFPLPNPLVPLSWSPSLDRSPPPPTPASAIYRTVKAYEGSPGAQDLSWQPELQVAYQLPGAPPLGGSTGPVLPPASTLAPLTWQAPPAILAQPIAAAPLARIVAPFAPALPVPALSWLADLTRTSDPPPTPGQGGVYAPQLGGYVVVPLEWSPQGQTAWAPPLMPASAAALAPFAPNILPPGVGWLPALTRTSDPPLVPGQGGFVGPALGGYVVIPMEWSPRGATAWAPPLAPASANPIAPFAPNVIPPGVGWLPSLARTSDPPPIPGQGVVVGPVLSGYVVVPLEWAPRGAGYALPPPWPGMVGQVGPFAPNVVPPGLGWLPSLASLPIAPARAADGGSAGAFYQALAAPGIGWLPAAAPLLAGAARADAAGAVRPLLFNFVVPPLAWAPIVAPTPALGRAAEMGAVGSPFPLPSAASPPLAWAPRLAPAGMPTPPVPFGGAVAPLSPAFPVPSLGWAPRGAAAVLELARAQIQALAEPLLSGYAVPPLAWLPSRASAAPAPWLPVAVQFGPFTFTQAPPLSWLARAAAQSVVPVAPAVAGATRPLFPPGAPVLSWSPAGAAAPPFPRVAPEARPVAPLAPLGAPVGWAAIAERMAEVAYPPLRAVPAPVLSLVTMPVLPQPRPPAPALSWQAISGLYFPPPLWIPLELIIGPLFVPPPPPTPVIPLPAPFVVQLKDEDGLPVNLTGLTVLCRTMPADRSRPVTVAFAEVVNRLLGVVQRTWTAQDVRHMPTGIMLIQFVTIDGAQRQRTYPGGGRYYHDEIVGRPR